MHENPTNKIYGRCFNNEIFKPIINYKIMGREEFEGSLNSLRTLKLAHYIFRKGQIVINRMHLIEVDFDYAGVKSVFIEHQNDSVNNIDSEEVLKILRTVFLFENLDLSNRILKVKSIYDIDSFKENFKQEFKLVGI